MTTLEGIGKALLGTLTQDEVDDLFATDGEAEVHADDGPLNQVPSECYDILIQNFSLILFLIGANYVCLSRCGSCRSYLGDNQRSA